MPTKIYGASDDLIELEGDLEHEFYSFGTDERHLGDLLVLNDGTILEVKFGKLGLSIWEIKLQVQGPLFDRIEPAFNEDDCPYSDVAYFKDGLTTAIYVRDWDIIRK